MRIIYLVECSCVKTIYHRIFLGLLLLLAGCDHTQDISGQNIDQNLRMAVLGDYVFPLEELYLHMAINGERVSRQYPAFDDYIDANVTLINNHNNVVAIQWFRDVSSCETSNSFVAEAEVTIPVADGITDQSALSNLGYNTNWDFDGDGVNNIDDLEPCSSLNPMPPEMVSIPAGCFDMGSPIGEEGRDASREMQRTVCLNPFSIGKYEVTLLEFDRYTSSVGLTAIRSQDENRDGYPARDVSWKSATAYASWLGTQDGNTYRLPTEEEWEYAARSSTTTAFNTGNSITPEQAQFGTLEGPVKVGTFAPNAFNLFDMHGNIAEMTCSEYQADYSGSSVCITNINAVENVVVRGGAHSDGTNVDDPGSTAELRSAARRKFILPDDTKNNTGFRLVKE